MPRQHRCDVPGCPRTRRRWQRLCEPCWRALPGDIRTGLIEAFRTGRKADWRALCKRAGEHRAELVADPARVPATEVYARNQRLLGEKP